MENLLILLVGPPGSGKSTFARDSFLEHINQDSQGKQGHLDAFNKALSKGYSIIVDRMGFSKEQRNRYLDPAKKNGYKTKIIVFHESKQTCLDRCKVRQDHETIKDEETANKAINFFFSKYERVSDDEADVIERRWPVCDKMPAIICDLDGTLCNVDHRLSFVKGPGKKDWKGFFKAMDKDLPNRWCVDLLERMYKGNKIVFCSGRPDNYRRTTLDWLYDHMDNLACDFDLFMRPRSDQRPDNVIKEVLLDFEILTKYVPYFIIDDRDQVVKMWRSRGYTCLQCADGNF